jgi:hypothetical protein
MQQGETEEAILAFALAWMRSGPSLDGYEEAETASQQGGSSATPPTKVGDYVGDLSEQ